jgi:hypothetical protein
MGDIVGPFTGATARFAVDTIQLPYDLASSRELGDDLKGDGTIDNQIGAVAEYLASQHAAATPADVIAAGVVASSIEIQADNLDHASAAGVWYFGAGDDVATPVGGSIINGVFSSNRTRTTRAAGTAIARLPILIAADPSVLELHAMEIDLTPDDSGGYDALVRGGITVGVLDAAAIGVPQMIASDPDDPYLLARAIDTNVDGVITAAEVRDSSLVQSMLAPDITFRGEMLVSIGFRMHLIPCDSGACAVHASVSCFNRVRDGVETDVDCGGICRKCPGGARCTSADDCASNVCESGVCRPPSCVDGISDGFETDIDCGWNCPGCSAGRICFGDGDCANHLCMATPGDFGTCAP